MLPHPSPLTDELRHLDPAPPTELSAAELDRQALAFEQIIATRPSAAPRVRQTRSRRRLVISVAGAAVVLCATLVASALAFGSGASVNSYALPAHGLLSSWTPTSLPASVTPTEVQACADRLGFAPNGDVPTVLSSDKRGDFTSVFLEQGDSDGYCVLAGGAVENSINFEGLKAHPLTDPNSAEISVEQGGEWMYVVSGHAGANVSTLAVKNPDTGQDVTAAVAKGVWSAWWPVGPDSRAWKEGSQGEDYDNAISISYTTSDGQHHQSSEMSDTDDSVRDAPLPDESEPVLGSLAGWSAASEATVASTADVDSCVSASGGSASDALSTVIAETRGSYESLLVKRANAEVYCVLKAGRVQWSHDVGYPATDSVATDTASLTQMNGLDRIDSANRVSEAQGDAAPGVTAVTLHLAGGNDVQASVQNGEWMAWWPEVEPATLGGPTSDPTDASVAPIPAGPPAISWTTADGVMHDDQ
ncbi:hypothetical protein [Subtercola lobariae]|uniref:Uncharacterized protein n=1 Tax=Subtercola lobariae TaxID=1588641 RepID=A0A917EXX3_9MICO|nr:hypothetical protein [Subtercola lobariae]GGF32336.1 hypothetical protein GCM10011399_26860 [Subtercola lobariae]